MFEMFVSTRKFGLACCVMEKIVQFFPKYSVSLIQLVRKHCSWRILTISLVCPQRHIDCATGVGACSVILQYFKNGARSHLSGKMKLQAVRD